MKRFSLHFFVAILTFTVSIFGTSLYFYQSSKKEEIREIETVVETKTEFRQSVKKVETVEETEPKSLSPYDLETYINNNSEANLDKIWQKLNISNQFNGLPNWEKNENFFESCASCETEIYEYDLDSEGGNEVILRIADTQELCRYLVFKKINFGENNWKLLGFIDHDFGRYQMPQHTFFSKSGKHFLAVEVQTLSGYISHYINRLFIVQDGKLIEILNFPASGHLSMDALNTHNFTGRFINYRARNDLSEIEIELKVNFTAWSNQKKSEILLWSKKQKAVYDVSPKTKKAILNHSKSDITQNEIDSIYNISSFTDEDVLKYYLPELKKIAAEKSEKNEWLRDFLYRFNHSPEKTTLEKILEN